MRRFILWPLLIFNSIRSVHGVPAQYKLQRWYNASNFFDSFDFQDSPNKWTHGFTKYVSRQEAVSSGLAKTFDGKVYLGVEYASILDSKSEGRKSVRLESKATFDQGLLIIDFERLPGNGCGMWPAFWLLHDSRPGEIYSEIDLIEGISLNKANNIAMFTSSQPCNMQAQPMSGQPIHTNCHYDPSKGSSAQAEPGCSIHAPDGTFGDDFNNKRGGVWALLLEDSGVKVWFFERNAIPGDVHGTDPNPETWGLPIMDYRAGNCNVRMAWNKMKIVINTTFCGAYAGDSWATYSQCREHTRYDTCREYVALKPKAFRDVYFLINSVRIFHKD